MVFERSQNVPRIPKSTNNELERRLFRSRCFPLLFLRPLLPSVRRVLLFIHWMHLLIALNSGADQRSVSSFQVKGPSPYPEAKRQTAMDSKISVTEDVFKHPGKVPAPERDRETALYRPDDQVPARIHMDTLDHFGCDPTPPRREQTNPKLRVPNSQTAERTQEQHSTTSLGWSSPRTNDMVVYGCVLTE